MFFNVFEILVVVLLGWFVGWFVMIFWSIWGSKIHQKSIKNLWKAVQNRSWGLSWGVLGPLGANMGCLGASWGDLGAILGRSGCHLGGILGVKLGILRHLIGIFCFIFFFDPNFSNFGANLASTWPFLAPSWAHVRGFWSLCWAMLRHVEASWSISTPKYWELLRLLKT